MAASLGRGKRAAARGSARRSVVVITSDQRQCLIEDVAYFRAERYRRTEPGAYRKQDRAAAEAKIELLVRRYGRREDDPE